MNCEGYWRRVCKIHYLSDERLARERKAVGSYKNAGLALLKREYGFRDAEFLKKHNIEAELEHGMKRIALHPVQPFCHGYMLRFISSTPNPTLFLIKNEGDSLRELGEIAEVFPRGYLSIPWCVCTEDRVLVYTSNHIWAEYLLASLPSPGTEEPAPKRVVETTYWEPTGDLLESYCMYSLCEDCGLVVAVTIRDKSLLCHFFVFEKNPKRLVQRVEFFRIDDELYEDIGYYALWKTCMISEVPSDDGSPCLKHAVYIQLGQWVMHYAFICSDLNFQLTGPHGQFSPHEENDHAMGEFCLTKDKTVLCFTSMGESYMWNLKTGAKTILKLDIPLCIEAKYLAVGHMYQILAIRHIDQCNLRMYITGTQRYFTLAMMDITRQRALYNSSDGSVEDLRMGYGDLRYRFYPALEQRWLDSLAYVPEDGVWIQHSIWSKQNVTNLYIGAPCS